VISVTQIFNYYKTYGYKTEVMGASFRNAAEIIELAGCDLLTISPALLDELRSTSGELERKLNPFDPAPTEAQIHLDEPAFRAMLADDRMATEKLDEGIRGFCKAIETLEAQLAHRLAELEGGAAFGHAVQEIFLLNDLDGDGCITREEWLGSDAVFDALDTDKDGRLAPEDVRGGLGAALALVAAIGVVRFDNLFSRMHAATKPQVLGLLLILAGIGLRVEDWHDLGLLVLVAVFQLMTAPIAAHMLGRAAYHDPGLLGEVDARIFGVAAVVTPYRLVCNKLRKKILYHL
jgi:monovalent cation/proton antiporter MnhG/PhaG subunit